MEVDSLPDRPLYLHEIRVLKEDSDNIEHAEAIFYFEDNINAVICFFINIKGSGHMMGYNPEEEKWSKLSSVDDPSNVEKFDSESDDIIAWIHNNYGEDGFGIYSGGHENNDR